MTAVGHARSLILAWAACVALATTGVTASAETVIRVQPGELTLEAAVSAARRARKATTMKGPVIIDLQPGVHRIAEPIHLSADDSGTRERPLVIRSRPGASLALVSGGLPLRELPSTPERLASYPEASRRHLRFFELPEAARQAPHALVARRYNHTFGLPAFEIFDTQGALHPARWPNSGWATAQLDAKAPAPRAAGRALDFLLAAETWNGQVEADTWVAAFFKHDWAYESIRLVARDPATTHLMLETSPVYGFAEAFRFAILHSASELDAPGEWHRHAASRELALWPRSEAAGPPTVSVSSGLFRLKDVRHVRFEGLALAHTRGDAIHVEGGVGIEVVGIQIEAVGGRAVVFEGPSDSFITSTHIRDTGDGGVVISGGDRALLQGSRLHITDTTITRFARLGLTYRPAISVHGVGVTVRGNFIAEAPHSAIIFNGNDHIIELNEIADVVREAGDAGAIYTGRDWTAQGTRIRHNLLRDIRGVGQREVKGIYLDDFASGIRVEGNIFLRVDQPVFIGGGRDNRVTDNLFIGSSPGVHIDGRGLTWAKETLTRRDGEMLTRFAAMPTGSPAWRLAYPELARTLADEPAHPKRNTARGNLFIGGEAYRLLPEVRASVQSLEAIIGTSRDRRFDPRLQQVEAAAQIRALLGQVPAGIATIPFDRLDRRLHLGSPTRW